MIAHTFNPSTSTREQRRQISERKASLGYKESSRIARAVRQRNPVSKKKSYYNTEKYETTLRVYTKRKMVKYFSKYPFSLIMCVYVHTYSYIFLYLTRRNSSKFSGEDDTLNTLFNCPAKLLC